MNTTDFEAGLKKSGIIIGLMLFTLAGIICFDSFANKDEVYSENDVENMEDNVNSDVYNDIEKYVNSDVYNDIEESVNSGYIDNNDVYEFAEEVITKNANTTANLLKWLYYVN